MGETDRGKHLRVGGEDGGWNGGKDKLTCLKRKRQIKSREERQMGFI